MGYAALIFAVISLLDYTFRTTGAGGAGEDIRSDVKKAMHFDTRAQDQDLGAKTVARRAVVYLAWLLGFMGSTYVIGMLPTIVLFVTAYMRVEGRERWTLALTCAGGITLLSWIVFDQLLILRWPDSLLGNRFPLLREYIPSM